MVYNEKLKRVISMIIMLVIVFTSVGVDIVTAVHRDDNYEEGELSLGKWDTELKKTLEKVGMSGVDTGVHVDIEDGSIYLSTFTDYHEIYSGKGIFNQEKFLSGDTSEYDSVMAKLIAEASIETIKKTEELGLEASEEDIMKLLDSLIKESNNNFKEKPITFDVISNVNGVITIKIYTPDGNSEIITLKEGMKKEEVIQEIETAIQKLIASLNDALKDLAGLEHLEELFKPYVIANEKPLVYGAEGRVLKWVKDGLTKQWLNEYEIPGQKDKNGNPIKIPVYGKPFGQASNGTYRFLGYSPTGDPLTNPFFRNDKEENVKFWARRKFKLPWDDKELATRMLTSKYKVDLVKIEYVDGNPDLNPLIWAGLQEYWKGYINDPAEQNHDWYNYVKFQIPPTETTWGLAYFPSLIGKGFWYATIPIPPKSYLGIDIQTASITPMPETVTGKDVRIRAVYNIEGVTTEEYKKEYLHKDYEVVLNSSIIPGGQIIDTINFNGKEKVVKEWDIVVPQLPCKLDAKGVPLPWGQQEVPTYEIETYINHPDVTEREKDKDIPNVRNRRKL